jgi:hypothetical protein
MRFARVRLRAPATAIESLAAFYGGTLGFAATALEGRGVTIGAGETAIEFAPGAANPFYHFAFLVPGDRFDAALGWAAAGARLLPDEESRKVVFEFAAWDARACYFHDPAGNIVELVAHHGIGESAATGAFHPQELIGLSELGLVGDPTTMAEKLARRLGLALWDGTIDEPGRLAFVGERGRTLILCPRGRGWLPTGRPAEPHAAEVILVPAGTHHAVLEAGPYRIVASDPPARHGV